MPTQEGKLLAQFQIGFLEIRSTIDEYVLTVGRLNQGVENLSNNVAQCEIALWTFVTELNRML